MEIKVLGACCGDCDRLQKNAQEAVKELGLDVKVEKVSDFKEIVSYGVMKTPALVINGKVKVTGRVISSEDIKKYIQG